MATVAVAGVDALETTFARYLPQVVLAAIVPVAVLGLVASIDLESAGIMLLTLPLVPVFMWLIGRYTELRTRERWQALSRSRPISPMSCGDFRPSAPSTGSGRDRRDRGRERPVPAGDHWDAASGFLSGAVLELAATLGIALVAVTVGVRLVDGGLGFEAGLTVLVLAPELYAPLRNLARAVPRQRRRRGRRRTDARPDRRASDRFAGRERGAGPAHRRSGSRTSGSATRGRPVPVLQGIDLELEPGETVALVGPSGSGKSTIASLLLRLSEPSEGRVTAGGADVARVRRKAGAGSWHGCRSGRRCFRGTVAENIRLGDPSASDDRVRKRPRWPVPTVHRVSCRAATTRWSATGRPLSAGRTSGSRWRGRSCATRRSSSSTNRPRTSIRRAPRSSRTRSISWGRTAPSCSSSTA